MHESIMNVARSLKTLSVVVAVSSLAYAWQGCPVVAGEEDRAGPLREDSLSLAFDSRRTGEWDVYLMRPDGSEQHRIADELGNGTHPSWSPDGTQLVFESDRDGDSEIWVMNLDGTNLLQITHNSSDDRHPAWRR